MAERAPWFAAPAGGEDVRSLVAEFSERVEDGRLVVDTEALNEHLHNIGPKWDLLTFMGLREEQN